MPANRLPLRLSLSIVLVSAAALQAQPERTTELEFLARNPELLTQLAGWEREAAAEVQALLDPAEVPGTQTDARQRTGDH